VAGLAAGLGSLGGVSNPAECCPETTMPVRLTRISRVVALFAACGFPLTPHVPHEDPGRIGAGTSAGRVLHSQLEGAGQNRLRCAVRPPQRPDGLLKNSRGCAPR